MKVRVAFLLLAALTTCGLDRGSFAAESQTDVKIRLMAEALTARDAGDFTGARRKLEALNQISPNDAGVRRLMTELDTKEAEQKAALANPPPPRAPEIIEAPRELPSSMAARATPEIVPGKSSSESPILPAATTGQATNPTSNVSSAGSSAEISSNASSSSGSAHPESGDQLAGIPVIVEGHPTAAPGPPDRTAEALATVEKQGVAFARAGDDRLEKLMAYVQAQRALARAYARDGNYAAATATLDEALASLKSSVDDLKDERQDYIRKQVEEQEAKKGAHLRHHR